MERCVKGFSRQKGGVLALTAISLAVMIGFARSAKGDGRDGLGGSPEDALNCFVFRTSLRVSAANPAFPLG